MTKVFLTTAGAGEYIIPAGVTSLTTIKAIGGGGSGRNYVGASGWDSGGGGEFAQVDSYNVTAANTYDYSVGASATWSSGQPGVDGGDSWFTKDGGGQTDIINANGGVGATYYVQGTGGTGGTGDTTYNGGNGGKFAFPGNGAGGGAGGDSSAGGIGANSAGSGYGGAGGGGGNGGNGGQNSGNTGGTGGTNANSGGAGGDGGLGESTPTAANGHNGVMGTDLDATHGSGGGGGGMATYSSGSTAGQGSKYGGGGGSAYKGNQTVGTGAQGVVALEFTAAAASSHTQFMIIS